MKRLVAPLQARSRLMIAVGVGFAIALLPPGTHNVVTCVPLGWNAAVWLYLVLVAVMMKRADHERAQRSALAQAQAQAQAEGAGTVLAAVILAAVASRVGIVAERAAAKLPGAPHALSHVMFALATVTEAWLLLPMLLAHNDASLYHRNPRAAGCRFPMRRRITGRTTATSSTALRRSPWRPDLGCQCLGARDAPDGAAAVGAVVRVQHRHPGLLDQYCGQAVLNADLHGSGATTRLGVFSLQARQRATGMAKSAPCAAVSLQRCMTLF